MTIIKWSLVFIGALALTVFTNSCTNEQAEELVLNECGLTPGGVSFADDIAPLLQTYCYFPNGGQSCHVSNGTAPGNYTSYQGVFNQRNKIRERTVNVKDMPPDYSTEGPATMTACEVETFRLWLNDGAPDN